MSIVSEGAYVTLNSTNLNKYKDLGYDIPTKITDKNKVVSDYSVKIFVKIEHLPKYSRENILCKCDNCEREYEIIYEKYYKSIKFIDGKYVKYCKICSNKLITIPKKINTELNKSKTFSEIMECEFGKDFINKHWDFDKNLINPYKTRYLSSKKIWIKCQNKDYHGSYYTRFSNFKIGRRCPYCSNNKTHTIDSIGFYMENNGKLNLWSDLNLESPFSYSCIKNSKAWFKCDSNIHEDYYRNISDTYRSNFECVMCSRERNFGWSRSRWIKYANESKNFESFKLYKIKLYNNNEEFYKIGITFTSMVSRMYSYNNYSYEIIDVIESDDGVYIWNLEKELHRKHKNNGLQYIPKTQFHGMTECFSELI